MWKGYAILSALFAALTAIFAKVGVKDVNSDLATAIRSSVILVLTWGIVLFGQHVSEIREVGKNALVFLVLSGLATGLSWLFYFKAIQLGGCFQSGIHRQTQCCHHHIIGFHFPA